MWGVVVCLACIVAALSVKVCLLRKAAVELREGIGRILETETNTLLTISSHDGEMKRLAAVLNVELRKLRGQRQRYGQGDLKLKEAVANISHDIRTPLTALCGYLDLTKQQLAQMPVQEDTETLRRYLGIMENRTEVLTQLTEELFRYTVVMYEISDVIYEEVILNHLLEESISIYYGALKENKITPVINMPEKLVKSKLNKYFLPRIIGNIIGNAIKYSDGDLHITLSERGEMIFSNHASGLDEVQAEKLFDRFYTVHTGRKSTGLGLSIAKQLTEQMGGAIDAGYRDGILSISLFFQ
ncbi:MAG: HAMP domain-containing histidine kinase [Lachnospiraceae bacterium]|nr:HAMP domain-containing histidine kinase [Lachnospiraceae bacterium]